MALPDTVVIKLNAYTLYCRQLLDHLQALRDATRDDKQLTCSKCCEHFDTCLHDFFLISDPRDLQEAAIVLGDSILGKVALFRTQNRRAAEVFDHVVSTARRVAPNWSYQTDLEILHKQGRELARYFYRGSPWAVTQACLSHEAQLKVKFDDGAPVAFRERYPDDETGQDLQDVILVQFTFNRNLDWNSYLAYPYLFMHEYVSHVFAFDYGYDQFNDGWLCYAAARFMARHGWDSELNLQAVLDGAQTEESLWQRFLHDNAKETCIWANLLDNWLNDENWLLELMWELAAYMPQSGEDLSWPDKFINRLIKALDTDRYTLKCTIENTPNLRNLFEVLPPA